MAGSLTTSFCMKSVWDAGYLSTYYSKGWTTRVRFPIGAGKGFILFATASRQVLGLTHPPIQWTLGAPSPWVKRPGREAAQSPPSTAEVKNA